jgi:purine nucleoside phosphorylase
MVPNPYIPVTNAAGGLNPHYKVGDIVVVNDVRSYIWYYL